MKLDFTNQTYKILNALKSTKIAGSEKRPAISYFQVFNIFLPIIPQSAAAHGARHPIPQNPIIPPSYPTSSHAIPPNPSTSRFMFFAKSFVNQQIR